MAVTNTISYFIWLWSRIGIAVWSNIKNCREINEENEHADTAACTHNVQVIWWFSHHNMEIIEQKNWLNSLKFIENICPRAWFVLWPCMHLDVRSLFLPLLLFLHCYFVCHHSLSVAIFLVKFCCCFFSSSLCSVWHFIWFCQKEKNVYRDEKLKEERRF